MPISNFLNILKNKNSHKKTSAPNLSADTLVAHRGLQKDYPENTLLSIKKAIDAGVKFIEIDIQFSKDKLPIICHDVGGISSTLPNSNFGKLFQPNPSPSIVYEWIIDILNPYNKYISLRKKLFKNFDEFTRIDCWQEYSYVFVKDRWVGYSVRQNFDKNYEKILSVTVKEVQIPKKQTVE